MLSQQNWLALTCLACVLVPGLRAGDSDAPVLDIELLSPATLKITWTNSSTTPVGSYELRSKPDLKAPEWISIQQVAPATGGVQSVELPIAAGVPSTFYQVAAQYWAPPSNMIWCPPGTFLMGSPGTEPGRFPNEGPQTQVTLTRGFWLGKFEVTQREYLAVTGVNPAHFHFLDELDAPVERVSWLQAKAYCDSLNTQERAAGRLPEGYEYRLPTEAQWEYACRAGTSGATAFGGSLSSSQANFDGTRPYNGGELGPYRERTLRVGSYAPNPWGFHDMHGNAWEWCADRYSEALPGGEVTDPPGPTAGSVRVLRGGGYGDAGDACRSATRFGHPEGFNFAYLGFRVALVRLE